METPTVQEEKLGVVLNDLYDMEQSNYQTLRIIQNIDQRIQSLGIKKNFKQINQNFFSFTKRKSTWQHRAYIAGTILGVLLPILYFFVISDASIEGIWDIVLLIVVMAFVGGVCTWGLTYLAKYADAAAYKMEQIKEKKDWKDNLQKQFAQRQVDLENDQRRVTYELEVREQLKKEKQEVEKVLQGGRNTIHEMYERAGIAGDYRNLIPMRYMASYYNLGISKKLDGTDGLYYLVRQELRADQFNASLQEISSKMDTLINVQSDIYRELVQIDHDVRNMTDELVDSIYSSASAVQAEIAKGTRISQYMSNQIEKQNSYLSTIANRW